MNNAKLKRIIVICVLLLIAVFVIRYFMTLQDQQTASALLQSGGQDIDLVIDTSGSGTQLTVTEVGSSSSGEAAAAEPSDVQEPEPAETQDYVEYRFRNNKLLQQHYEKHGMDMGFASAAEYEKAASDVANDPSALHKTEKEDGDDIYYIEATNDFVVISTDGYIRTYFWPDSGKKYYDKQ